MFLRISFVLAGLTTLVWSVAAPAEAAKLLELQEVGKLAPATSEMVKRMGGFKGLPPSRHMVRMYRAVYETPDLSGKASRASGLIAIPEGATGRLPVVSYQHGTTTSKADVPSNPKNAEAMFASAVMGSIGYVVVAADYLGLGVSEGMHPYLHAETEASAAADLIEVARDAAAQLKIELSSALFLAGYSQGGHATMALHRRLEADTTHGYDIVASAPMAGPYDLSDVTMKTVLRNPSPMTATYAAYLVMGLNQVYRFAADLKEVFQEAYAARVTGLLDGSKTNAQVKAALPATPQELLRAEFIEAVLNGRATRFIQALEANNLYGWTPRAPMLLAHGSADLDVPFENSRKAADLMAGLGAPVRLFDCGPLNHGAAIVPAIQEVVTWFEKLRSDLK